MVSVRIIAVKPLPNQKRYVNPTFATAFSF